MTLSRIPLHYGCVHFLCHFKLGTQQQALRDSLRNTQTHYSNNSLVPAFMKFALWRFPMTFFFSTSLFFIYSIPAWILLFSSLISNRYEAIPLGWQTIHELNFKTKIFFNFWKAFYLFILVWSSWWSIEIFVIVFDTIVQVMRRGSGEEACCQLDKLPRCRLNQLIQRPIY